MTPTEKCLTEQRRCVRDILAGSTGPLSAELGLADWVMEEVLIMWENCHDQEECNKLMNEHKGANWDSVRNPYAPGATRSGVPIEIIPLIEKQPPTLMETLSAHAPGGMYQGCGQPSSQPILQTLEIRPDPSLVRVFESGAIRSSDDGKPDFEGFLSPLVIERYAEYMHKHRHLPDGTLRASDNWQRGFPKDQLVKSAWRHMMDWWVNHRGYKRTRELVEESVCALIFNASAWLHQTLSERKYLNED